MPMPRPKLPRRRGRWLATVALVVAAAVVVVIVVSNNGSANGGRSGAGTTATGAATVQRRNLVATDTESGTLSYADAQTVYNRLSGTITWVPQVGADHQTGPHAVHGRQQAGAADERLHAGVPRPDGHRRNRP